MKTYSSSASGTAVQYLVEQFEGFNRWKDEISQDISQIKRSSHVISTKLDLLITNLVLSVSSIKKEDRDIDEKLILIEEQIESVLKKDEKFGSSSKTFERIASKTLSKWPKLDVNTKIFLISAEYLFSSLQKIDNADFSPCVIQFSKALENELFIKLFKPFIDLTQKNPDLNEFLIGDMSRKETLLFAQQVLSGSRERKLALGQMLFILQKVKLLIKSSYIMKAYANYLKNNKVQIEKPILLNIEMINKDLRRRSAHPEVLSIEMAKEAKNLIPEAINNLPI